MLVEDDPEDQEVIMKAIHSVSSATGCYAVSNGEEALETLLQEDFNADYIITDIEMPRMNGLEFLKILKGIDKFQNIPVIVLSSDYSEDKLQKVRKLGATAFYSKTHFRVLKEILQKHF